MGTLFIVFLILKLNPGGHFTTGVTDWSWWWVTAPLWGPLALVVVIFAVGAAVLLIKEHMKKKRRGKAWENLNKRV